MKEIIKVGSTMFAKLIVLNLMCFFMVISISVITTALFSQNIGYTAFGVTSESEEAVELYQYYYTDGDDTKLKEYQEQGYTVSQKSIRSKVSAAGNAVFLTVTQIICIILLISIIYPTLWQRGTKDSNLVHFKHQKSDPFKGLKCGFVAIIPTILLFLVLMLIRKGIAYDFPLSLIRLMNASFYSFDTLIFGEATILGELPLIKLIMVMLLQLIVPVIAFISYYLGYKNISLSEKIIYKNK